VRGALSAEAVIKRTRRIPERKVRIVEELSQLISSSRVIAVFRLVGLRANLLHEVRRKLRGMATIKIAKKNLFIKACEKAGKPDLRALVDDFKEPLGFIFSNTSAFRLKIVLDKNRIPMHARAGERADLDVVVPEMNTGLPPGPILSEFGKLKIPTKIEGGQIWIAKDTVVARKGDVISPELASLLARLDIKAVLKGISIEKAFEDGILLTREQLELDLEKTSEEVRLAHIEALSLAMEIGYITRETVIPLLIKGALEARALVVEAEIPSKETIQDIILLAERRAQALKAAAKLE
jgi:large subunit ribosomal protein L10